MGIGVVDTYTPLCMRMLGMHGAAFANYAVDDCDFLFALGARFDDRVAGVPAKFARNAKRIAHIDIDRAEVNKVKRAHWSYIGSMADALRALTAFGKRQKFERDYAPWHAHLADLKSKYAMNYDRNSPLIQPYYVIEEINKVAKGQAIIATGVGQHQMWAAQYCDFRAPRLWLTSGSMGTMGFGLPAAIGAQIANPNRLVIDIDGDSSVRMNVGELETVTTYDLPIKVVVLNNFGDGMVKQWQKLFHKGRLSASDRSLHKKDFVKAAQADGFRYAVRLDRKEDVPRVIEEFMKFDGPAFLEVMIDRDAGVYPMVGPGQAYEDMITVTSFRPVTRSRSRRPARRKCSDENTCTRWCASPISTRRSSSIVMRWACAKCRARRSRRVASRSYSSPPPAMRKRRSSSPTTGTRSPTLAAATSAIWPTRSMTSMQRASACGITVSPSTARRATGTWRSSARPTIFPSSCCRKVARCRRRSRGSPCPTQGSGRSANSGDPEPGSSPIMA